MHNKLVGIDIYDYREKPTDVVYLTTIGVSSAPWRNLMKLMKESYNADADVLGNVMPLVDIRDKILDPLRMRTLSTYTLYVDEAEVASALEILAKSDYVARINRKSVIDGIIKDI
jgi:hypothetical protein